MAFHEKTVFPSVAPTANGLWRHAVIVLTARALVFANSRPGFAQFLAQRREVKAIHGMTDVVIGIESTGHYGSP